MSEVIAERDAAREGAEGVYVEPLILAAEAYPRMEALALGATHSLLMAFRIFAPDTRLRSAAARAQGLATWGDLLAERAAEGVEVRLFLADFDRVFAPELAAGTRTSLDGFAPFVERARGRLGILAARHRGEVGPLWRTALWPLVRARMAGEGWPEADRRWPAQRLWPATHHMKVMVADARAMVIGGLDVNERRFDDRTHDRPAEETWHDVSLHVQAEAAREANDFVRGLWLRELALRERGLPSDEGATLIGAAALPARPHEHDDASVPFDIGHPRSDDGAPTSATGTAAADTNRDGPRVTFHTTRSRRSRSPFARGPQLEDAGLLETIMRTIGHARRLLYIENQFVRDRAIGVALAEQLRAHPDLQLIMVLPAAPDVVAFASDRSAGALHGEWLQLSIVDALGSEFPDRFGVFTLAGARPPQDDEVRHDRAALGGRGIVYLHSKVMIADDEVAHVSSANLNGRSLRMDTEAGVVWRDPAGVADFRRRLWQHHLGEALPAAGDSLTAWRDAASRPLAEPGSPRHGRPLVRHWDRERVRRDAKQRAFVPARYV